MLFVLTALAAPAMADNERDNNNHNNENKDKDKDKDKDKHKVVPEIDAGSMLGGLTLLAGGAFILADRRRDNKPQVGLD
jgi:hypothetical protein